MTSSDDKRLRRRARPPASEGSGARMTNAAVGWAIAPDGVRAHVLR
jgi:hypothetical protein